MPLGIQQFEEFALNLQDKQMLYFCFETHNLNFTCGLNYYLEGDSFLRTNDLKLATIHLRPIQSCFQDHRED